MDRTQPQGRLAAAVIATLLCVSLYVGGYLFCPKAERAIGYDRIVYSVWLARLFAPLAHVESVIVGTNVNLHYQGGLYQVPPDQEEGRVWR